MYIHDQWGLFGSSSCPRHWSEGLWFQLVAALPLRGPHPPVNAGDNQLDARVSSAGISARSRKACMLKQESEPQQSCSVGFVTCHSLLCKSRIRCCPCALRLLHLHHRRRQTQYLTSTLQACRRCSVANALCLKQAAYTNSELYSIKCWYCARTGSHCHPETGPPPATALGCTSSCTFAAAARSPHSVDVASGDESELLHLTAPVHG